ncbi:MULTISPECIES: hypothetical protein [unclassified Chromobacterium]|uniref:hypothetical protein n=1 Tax=unclassified Chromobacterium TaxID=2641838 RepID=UPI001F28E9E5|nr:MULTISPECIES: hypothetical protein [unclassified Chromobacterium]MCP1293300.1 hypothetical protein [Chromobacterium sp. S0633]UJB32744.1 hypothetical protein HQN78_17820 [Chromobacterium sp. Beijing]
MMDIVIVDGTALVFEPMFGNRIVTPCGPAQLRGSGHPTIQGRKVCVAGDEKQVQVNAIYTTATHTIPGNGVITISLTANQQATHVKSGASWVLKGQQFIAQFRPTTPAQQPGTPPVPDVTTPSLGKGQFMPTQSVVRGS